MTKVLITGGSGFIAKHIIRELFEKGYEVRASVRNASKEDEIRVLFPGKVIEFVHLDLNSDQGWDDALKGVDVLMHTASPFPIGEPKNPDDIIRPAVDGTLRALIAAKNAGVNRVILTSSCVAVYGAPLRKGQKLHDENDWSNPSEKFITAYDTSKTLAEKAAWDFAKANPEIKLTTINPGLVTGPAMDKNFGTSLEYVEQIYNARFPANPPMTMPFVDVRNVAFMHVAAIDNPKAEGERFIASIGSVSFAEMAKILAELYPERGIKTRELPAWLVKGLALFNKDLKGIAPYVGLPLGCSGAKAEAILGVKFIDAKTSLADTTKFFETLKS